MLVATVITTVVFQGAINPPGGVWQQDIPFNSNITIHRSFHSSNTLKTFIAGIAVMAYPTSCQGNYYTAYLVTTSISFFKSVCVIMFIIGRLPLKKQDLFVVINSNHLCCYCLLITQLHTLSLARKCLIQEFVCFRINVYNSMVHFVSNGGSGFSSLYCYSFPTFGGEASRVGSKKVVSLALWHLERSDHFNHNLNKYRWLYKNQVKLFVLSYILDMDYLSWCVYSL